MESRTESDITQIAESLVGIKDELKKLNAFLLKKALSVTLLESKLDVDVNNTVFISNSE